MVIRALRSLLAVVMFVAAAGVLSSCNPTPPVCNIGASAPSRYAHVVVFAFENRTWSSVGGSQFQQMPYLHSLAVQCATFSDYTEPNPAQNSASQYVGQAAGTTAPLGTENTVQNDCAPSTTCRSVQDNIFRQVRAAGLTARSYVEGATAACSTSGNAAKHIPALYFQGGTDWAFCSTEVVPYSTFNPDNLPAFAFVTPTACNDGHDCTNDTVDAWARTNIGQVLSSAEYRAGNVAVFVWYDEDHPVPNMQITHSARPGPYGTAVTYGSTLRAWDDMLGLPRLADAATAADMRAVANL